MQTASLATAAAPQFPQVRRVDARTCSTEEAMRILREDGCVILEHAISPQEADAIVADMDPWIGSSSTGLDDFAGKNTIRCGALPARSPTFNNAILRNRLLRAAADEHLLQFSKRYQLHVAQVIKIGPKSPAQALHRDRVAWGKFLPDNLEPMVATIWALNDFTKEIGATLAIPKSHKRPFEDFITDPEGRDVCSAVMPKGSAILYLGSTIHAGGANVTADKWRIGMHVSFSLGWLRSEENQYLSVPPEVAKTLDKDIQELIGYSMMDHSMGYYSPATKSHMPAVRPEKFEDQPYGSDTLAPELMLGRTTRPWSEAAGTKKDSSLAEGHTAELGVGNIDPVKAKM